MSVNVRVVKRSTEETKKKEPEVKLTEKSTKLLESIEKMDVAEKLFNLEDKIAIEMTHDAIFEEFNEDYKFLRAALEEYMEGKPTTTASLAKVARLRRNTRLCHYATAQMRKEVAERMDLVDAKLLQLQNVTSEVQHIQKEIDRCLDFSAGDEGLELIPVEEFYAEAPVTLSKPDETTGNEHEQYLVRLQYEDDQRRELLSTLNELEGRRNVLQSDIRGKEVRLQGLKPKLEDLAKVAEPVFDIVGAKFKDLKLDGEQRKLSLALPAPLAVAHIHATAYKEIHDDKMFEFRIVGSNDTVKHPKDEAETKRRRKEDESTQEKINETATKILDVHPMSLEFDIECANEIKITMTIQYLTELKVTTAKWMVHGDSKARKSVLFCADSLMSDLFENDSGDKCPNKVGSLKIEHLKLNFNSNAKSTGKPYLFIQELSGSDQQIEGVAVTEHLRKIVKAIRQRVADRCALDSIIRDLESKKTEGLEVATDVKICSFKNCEDEAFIASIPTSLRDQISGGTSSDRFSFKLEATNGDNKKLIVFLSIPSDYPRHAALFGINAPEDANSEIVNGIEERLNDESLYVDNPSSLKEQLSLLLKHFDLS
ncbi:hypothetical protein GCK72_010520 [Caenorhabditis remanei]|uniref:Uncharacterized protein n=1 Tax=Caenorhabditis remanei TaxID=31234 RepID=A0A6A5H3I5_CAERE|nr:hypothetical protein GCK72_010520 [Caenorhabditis remanei]KAF1762258.1 hypothetical protein GCK72_010520 [Caenorhabditis remanei]